MILPSQVGWREPRSATHSLLGCTVSGSAEERVNFYIRSSEQNSQGSLAATPPWLGICSSSLAPFRLCRIVIPPPSIGFAQTSCKTSPPSNKFPLQQELYHILTLLGKPNPEGIEGWVLWNRHAQACKIEADAQHTVTRCIVLFPCLPNGHWLTEFMWWIYW